MIDAPDNRDGDPVPERGDAGAPAAKKAIPWLAWVKELALMAAIVAAVLLVVGALQRERQRGGGGVLAVASEAPAFSVESLDGRVTTSSELRGKPLVLVFWATWCGVCQEEMPALERFAAAAAGRYQVLAVSRESESVLRRWASRGAHAIDVARDPGGRASAAYKVESLPTHVIIDGAGRVVHDFSGAADPEILAEHMQRLL